MSKQNIYLIGLMAVGKSTVGRMLAHRLGYEFYDSDHIIEERAGADIGWIFDVEGEAGFRERETAVLDDLTRLEGIVLATGGGAILRAENRSILAARGTVIHLDSPLQRLVERTEKDKKRPLLNSGNPAEILARLYQERNHLYAEIADCRFVTDRQSPKVLARAIENCLQERRVI